MKIKFWFIDFDTKDSWTLIGFIVALIGLYRFHLVLGIITIVAGLFSKLNKSKYWKYVIFGGILDFAVYLINTFWI